MYISLKHFKSHRKDNSENEARLQLQTSGYHRVVRRKKNTMCVP